MPLLLKNSRIFRWTFRLLKYSAVTLLTVILLLAIIVAFLPTAVSTQWSHDFITEQASLALHRPVAIETLNWSWSEGIIISRLVIPDLPEFSENELVSIDDVNLKINLKRLLHREVNLEFRVTGLYVNIIKSTGGALNLESLAKKDQPPTPVPKPATDTQKEKAEKTEGKKEKKPLVLPVDICSHIHLNKINLSYADQAKAEKYLVKDLDILFNAPSVKTQPVRFDMGVDLQVNDQVIPRSTLTLSVKHLFDKKGTLTVDGLAAALDASLPGINALIDADMSASEVQSRINIDLASVLSVAAPLIPMFPSPTEIKGTIELTAATGTRPEDPLAFDAILSAKDLAVSGKVIDGKSIGPGNFSVHLNGILDLQSEKLDLISGDIRILENSHIRASATVEQLKQENKYIQLAISPLFIDVDELTSFAAPFIPASILLGHPEKNTEVSLKELKIVGHLPKGRTDVTIADLSVTLPEFALKDQADGKQKLKVSGTGLKLEQLSAVLTDLFPESAALKISLIVDELLNGKAPGQIRISNICLDHLSADAAEIYKSEPSKFKIAGNVSINNKLKIGQLLLPDLVQINDLAQSLNIRADLRPDGTVKGSLDHLDVTGQKISVLKKGIGSIDLEPGIDIHLALDEVFLKNLEPVNLDITDFIARMTAGNAVSVAINASAADTGNTSFNADVKIDSDLAALAEKIPPKMLSGLSGSGKLNLSLNAAGRRPVGAELDALKTRQIKGNLGFIDHLKFDILVNNGAVEIARPDKSNITIGSISASPLLSYELIGKTGKGDLSCLIQANEIKGLPALNPDAPFAARLSLSGHHDFAGAIELHQALTVSPAGIEESINISIDGLDRIISQSPMPKPALWIADAGSQIEVNVNIPAFNALKEMGLPGLSEMDLSGQADAGLLFQMVPNKSVGGGLLLSVKDMNVGIPDKFSAQKINTNIDFSKAFLVRTAGPRALAPESSGLSGTVIESAARSNPVAENNDIFRHIRLVHERSNPSPSLSFEKADIAAAPFPIAIGESLVMLNLKNGLPNLDYFQFNLMGGTINGSVFLVEQQKEFFLNSALTFSGINTADIFPDAFSGNSHSDADISGSLYADVPVTDQLQAILENAAIRIEFTRIGSRALERLLYALDPYESNEAIVSQRRLLKNGSPKQVRLEIKDGFLSLRGEVSVKGIDISLPAIRRLNIAQIPGLEKFREKLAGLTPVISILKKVSADKIIINKQAGTIVFE